MSIRLGSLVRDQVTGFKGVAVARTEYLFTCPKICVRPNCLKDALPIADQWFEEGQLIVDGQLIEPGHYL